MAGARQIALLFLVLGIRHSECVYSSRSPGVLYFVSTLCGGYLLGRAGELMTRRMREALFSSIVQQVGEAVCGRMRR